MAQIEVDDLLSALEDFTEASRELGQMQSEYTGYSPSYHLASWMDAREKASEHLKEVLDQYIAQQVEIALKARASESREI